MAGKIYDSDPYLEPFKGAIDARSERIGKLRSKIAAGGTLSGGVNNELYYGLHREKDGSWVFREWAPNARRIFLVGEFNNWKRTPAYELKPLGHGDWEVRLPSMFIHHGELYKIYIEWPGGGGERIPAYATRAVQDPVSKIFCAQAWDPAEKYVWKNPRPGARPHPLIYECHIGMSSEEPKVASFDEFRRNVLPHIASCGYDTIQIMALQEHPYYGSFGYQVSTRRTGWELRSSWTLSIPTAWTTLPKGSVCSTAGKTTCTSTADPRVTIPRGDPAASTTARIPRSTSC